MHTTSGMSTEYLRLGNTDLRRPNPDLFSLHINCLSKKTVQSKNQLFYLFYSLTSLSNLGLELVQFILF